MSGRVQLRSAESAATPMPINMSPGFGRACLLSLNAKNQVPAHEALGALSARNLGPVQPMTVRIVLSAAARGGDGGRRVSNGTAGAWAPKTAPYESGQPGPAAFCSIAVVGTAQP